MAANQVIEMDAKADEQYNPELKVWTGLLAKGT